MIKKLFNVDKICQNFKKSYNDYSFFYYNDKKSYNFKKSYHDTKLYAWSVSSKVSLGAKRILNLGSCANIVFSLKRNKI